MTNTSRNTIVLSSLLLIILSLMVGVIQNLSKKQDALEKENKDSARKIAVLDSQISNIDSLLAEYEIRKAMVAQQSKVILDIDNPTITYQYLLKLMNWARRNVIFSFASSPNTNKEVFWNEYVLSGSANYMDLAVFTQHLENQRALVTIEDFSLSADGMAKSDTVSFSMIIRTHFKNGGISQTDLTPRKFKGYLPSFQLFKSRVWDHAQTVEEIDPRIVDIDQSTLIGISDNRIFLRDSQGVIRILAVRDKVVGGYLYNIDQRQGKAVFKIDKYGIPEHQVIYLAKEN